MWLWAQANDLDFPGPEGFIPGARGSLMLDVVFVAMLLVVPLMGWSIYHARYRKRDPNALQFHKRLQLTLAIVLLLAIVAFEVDLRFFSDWELRAAPSRFYEAGVWNAVWYSLTVHLVFAVPTTFLWAYVVIAAWRKFPNPPAPSEHSRSHVFWGRWAAFTMLMTAVTGWIFYVLAFVG